MDGKLKLEVDAMSNETEPTWANQLWHARQMESHELRRHATVSTHNRHRCEDCFCCAALTVLEERHSELKTDADKARRILDAMEGN